MNTLRSLFAPLVIVLSLVICCSSCERGEAHLLDRQDAAALGVDFVNVLTETDTFNPLLFEYIYNGAGVATGDFDGNGLPDLFFTGNMVSCRLYLQTEPWKFTDVTEAAGLTTDVWVAGVSVHDVDGNGYDDLYLAALTPEVSRQFNSPNLLYLNSGPDEEGRLRFREAAAEYGIDDARYGTHSAWFDLEGDGDMDLYVLNNSVEEQGRKLMRGTDTTGTAVSLDVIYENRGPGADTMFVATNLIRSEGWGLGVVPQDFNLDGRTDLYVANDFISEDGYLVNIGDGTLSWQTQEAFAHTSKNSMGVDAGDLNNDGRPDLVSVDMLPDDNLRQKTMFGDISFSVDDRADQMGYGRQYVHNALQVNNGDGTFSDLAFQTGTAATDWSWSPLLADFDNDGYRDLFISNGYPKDITNRDFVDYSQVNAMFGKDEEIFRKVNDALQAAGGVHQPNFIYRNGADLNFERTNWMEDTPTYSNGAVYVDLDNDGDLDLVTNNINEPAGIYRNQSRELDPEGNRYLQFDVRGGEGNPDGLGTKVYLRNRDGWVSYAEHQRQRGYLSNVGNVVHFGVGNREVIDTVMVVVPGGEVYLLPDVATNQRITLDLPLLSDQFPLHPRAAAALRELTGAPARLLVGEDDYSVPVHVESTYSTFDNVPLAIRDHTRAGPVLLAVDLDGDGSEELVLGGSAGTPTRVYRQTENGLAEVQDLEGTTVPEATALVGLDYDGDGDQDLYVGHGSEEFRGAEDNYRDLLFENVDGRLRPAAALPARLAVTATVATADLEGDGDPDLFVGVRHATTGYPDAAASYVLVNDNGRFTPGDDLELGLVTDAVWRDLNGDGRPDLSVVSEYAEPRIGINREGRFEFQTLPEAGKGWWYSLTTGDLDGDGDTDLLLGNYGTNGRYQASRERPLTLRVEDYDDNGMLDPILMMYNGEEAYPVHPRNTLGRQLPGFKRQATTYAQYGGWSTKNMPDLREQGYVLEANELRSAYLENRGDGTFAVQFLPAMGQTAPLRNAILSEGRDGKPVFLAVQNDYAVEVLGGRMDAGTGVAIGLNEDGKVSVDPGAWSVRADARSVVKLGERVLVGVNNGPVRVYRKR